MMKFLSKIICLSLTLTVLCGCANNIARTDPRLTVDGFAVFEKKLVQGGDFLITTYQKITDPTKPYVFYIEGDGAAFKSRYTISDDPTPRQDTLLDLVAVDDRPNVIYIARPCQFTTIQHNPRCSDNSYWSNKRLAPEVIAAINEVINKINNGQNFSLVGYSGGGAAAVLVAARNNRVKNIVTLAGNLDIKSFAKYHNSKPLQGSLNPIDVAFKLNTIPQMHFSGEKDSVVPTMITRGYIAESNNPVCVKMRILDGVSHAKNWGEMWKNYNKNPECVYD